LVGIEHVATPDPFGVTAPHPEMVAPLSVKATDPAATGDPPEVTVAVYVTAALIEEGLIEEARAVVVPATSMVSKRVDEALVM
jgi:hypothetical protein